MRKIILSAFAVFIVSVLSGCMKQDFSGYEKLVDPAISEKPAQKVLVVEVIGDPNKAGMKQINALYGMYFKLKGKIKDMPMPGGPRARWSGFEVNAPKDQWKGTWALPVPDSVTELPAQKSGDIQVRLDTWKYGTVAEILHKGAYTDETPTIEKLHNFVSGSGYVISGEHEEEYLKGPGMFGKGDPKKYLTIIRYDVKKGAMGKKAGKK